MPDDFSEEPEAGLVTVDFGDYGDNLNADLWRSLRDYLIETADIETADRVIPTYKIDSLLEMALRPPPEPLSTYSEKPMPLTEQELEQREHAIRPSRTCCHPQRAGTTVLRGH